MIEQFIKSLDRVCDLLYYDGPWVSLMKDDKDNPYLMFAVEIDDRTKGWKWIVFRTSKPLLRKFINKKLAYDQLRETRVECDILGRFGVQVSIGVERYPVPIKIVYNNITMLQNTDPIDSFEYFDENMMRENDLENLKEYLK